MGARRGNLTYLLYTRHCAKCFSCIIVFNSHVNFKVDTIILVLLLREVTVEI